MTERIPCAVLGATGYIGQHFVRMLSEHPWFDLIAVTSSGRTSGARLNDVWNLPGASPGSAARLRLSPTSPAALARAGVQVAFSALPREIAAPAEPECRRRRVSVFTNASAHRRDPDVPLIVPEVNPGHLAVLGRQPRAGGILVANPNCTATGLVVALKPVIDLLAPRSIHVTTYQALSGAGFPGLASLSALDNVVPYIFGEEEKVESESQIILGGRGARTHRPRKIPILANCARVPVRDGHLEAVTVEAGRRPLLRQIRDAWSGFDPLRPLGLPTAPHPPVVVRPEADRPQPLMDRWEGSSERSRGMTIVVGRIRWEPPFLRFFLLSHNAVRGGAGGSILNAELARERGLLTGTRGGRDS
ncbi:MAG TPA: aspartate-semialdehyde dehydrogenase [Thermoplasmata archaeon]|nr:aspartate-semialdehyde dehydrogenase [Thermoplasmata archaeon]